MHTYYAYSNIIFELCKYIDIVKGVCCGCPHSMNEVLKRGGEGDGPLGMELSSNLNKVGGNLDLLWGAGIG